MRLMSVRRVSCGVTAALALSLVSTSCTAQSAASLAATHITVGALPVVDNVGLYIAADEGIFKRFGLSVTIRQVQQSAKAIPEMKTGEINIIGGANDVSFIAASASAPADPPFRLVMEAATCAPNTFDVLTLPSSHITQPVNLVGKTVAVNLNPNVQTLTINAILSADGVKNPSLAVHYKVIPFPAMVNALQTHQVDVISAVEPGKTWKTWCASGRSAPSPSCSSPTTSTRASTSAIA